MDRMASIIQRTPGSILITCDGGQTWGLMDRTTDLQVMGNGTPVLGTTICVTIPTGSLSGLKKRASITAGGVAFRVRECHLVDDGALTRAWLEEA
jgi:hypothetical protein